MSYQDYESEDFIQDETFIRWVKDPDPALEEFWQSWLADHPEKRATVAEAKTLLQNLDFDARALPPATKAQLWDRIAQQTIAQQPAQVMTLRSRGLWLRVAAVAAILIMVAWGGWSFLRNTEQVISTTYGQQKTIQLSDGTQVILNANSTLRYDDRQPRLVQLQGEAYFQVAKKPESGADFRVITKDLSVRVLGTVFNVSSRSSATEVYLEEGKVNLEIDAETDTTVEMTPGDLVSYSKPSGTLLAKQRVNAIENTSWKDGTLMFVDAPLQVVLRDLTELYGVSFRVGADSLATKRITGGVPIKNLKIALETLKGIYGVEIDTLEGTLLIKP